MVDSNERRRAPRKAETAPTPKPDTAAAAPRKGSIGTGTSPGIGSVRADPSPEEIRRLISEAAYYRAMERGFEPGHELEDWIAAEAEVMGRVSAADR